MEKVTNITQEQFEAMRKVRSTKAIMAALLTAAGLPINAKYGMGDSLVAIPNAEHLGLYRNEWAGRQHYYLAVSVVDERAAFCWTLYPTAKGA